MSPTSERRLPRPSVEARVQLDRVELLCVPGEPSPGCQRGLVQDGVPVVVAPSRRPDPDVTHSSPIAAVYRVMLEAAYSNPPRLLSQSIALRSRPAGLPTTRLSPPEHTRRTDRAASAPHNSENYRVDTDKRNAMPRTRARANRSRCGGSGWRSSPRRDCTAHSSVIPMAPLRSGLIDERRLGQRCRSSTRHPKRTPAHRAQECMHPQHRS